MLFIRMPCGILFHRTWFFYSIQTANAGKSETATPAFRKSFCRDAEATGNPALRVATMLGQLARSNRYIMVFRVYTDSLPENLNLQRCQSHGPAKICGWEGLARRAVGCM